MPRLAARLVAASIATGLAIAPAVASAYDRGAAVAYAAAWCGARNGGYADYSDVGGDCANFVSQCLIAGGQDLHGGGCAWIDAHGCAPSAGGLGLQLQALGWQVLAYDWGAPPPAGIEPGDVVIASWDSSQACCGPYCSANDHAMIVVGTNPLRYSGHTTDRCGGTWWYPDTPIIWLHAPPSCSPQCADKHCGGDDGCGGQCPVAPVAETCNGADDDCDGQVDEDVTRHCGSDVGECRFGTETCAAGQWGACVGAVGPTPEVCDGRDDDCDGAIDDDGTCDRTAALDGWLGDLSRATTDVDGDGRADACALTDVGLACALSRGHGFDEVFVVPRPAGADWSAESVYATLRVGDVDGDGRADACLRDHDGVACFLSAGHGLGRRIPGPRLDDAAGFGDPSRYTTIRLADVDADGKADLCARTAEGFVCHRATGHGFEPLAPLAALADAAGFDAIDRAATIRMGDVDGDGRADVCARDAAGMACWLSTGRGFGPRVAGPAWSDASGFADWRLYSTIRLADVDGDGRADLCAREPDGVRCALFDGQGFGRGVGGPALDPVAPGGFVGAELATIRVGDVDGDGASDLCGRDAAGLACWLGSPRGFDRRVEGPRIDDADGWDRAERYRSVRLGDVDGDGREDVCVRGADGLRCFAVTGEGVGRALVGPAWSDDAGFTAAARYETVRLGGARRVPVDPATPAPGPATSGPALGADDLGMTGTCSAAPGGSRGDAGALAALVALALAARRRARR